MSIMTLRFKTSKIRTVVDSGSCSVRSWLKNLIIFDLWPIEHKSTSLGNSLGHLDIFFNPEKSSQLNILEQELTFVLTPQATVHYTPQATVYDVRFANSRYVVIGFGTRG